MNLKHKWNWIKKTVFVCWLSVLSVSAFAQSADSSFTSLQKALVNPAQVKKLDLSKERLKDFPLEITQFENLEVLDLSKNRFDSIPPAIQKLTQLKTLDLSRNRLKYLPSEIGQLKQLRVLNLGANKIETLPETIGNLTELRTLVLWSNNIDELPHSIKNCDKIEFLDMRAIFINREKQEAIISLMPFDADVKLSLPCNCD